jgi:hypothetical protein
MAFAAVLAGTALSAVSTYQAGRAREANARGQQALALYNARVQEQTAKAIEMKGKFDQIRFQRRARAIQGKLRARLGASGALMTTGAPLFALAETASELALESALIGYETITQAARARSGAALSRAQASIQGQKARFAKRAGGLGAAVDILGGVQDMDDRGMLDRFFG